MIRLVSGVCVYCRRPITANFDEQSTLAWCSLSGDYGCLNHPLNGSVGWEHQPQAAEAVTLSLAVNRLFAHGERGAEYLSQARQLAIRLGYNPYQARTAS